MRLAARQKGFTLLGFILTMSLVISVIAGAGVYMVEKFGESGATQLGVRMAEYNGAVGRYIQENVATITSNASYSGIAWLQNSSCGGGAVSDYLPCAYPSSLPFDLAYQTAITVSGSDITATVTYGPGSLQFRGKWRLDFAETAKNKAVENQIGGLRLSQNFVVTASNILQSTVSTVGATEPWLRIDGSNSPTANIDWNNKSITNLDCLDFGDANICTDGTGRMNITATNDVSLSDDLIADDVYLNYRQRWSGSGVYDVYIKSHGEYVPKPVCRPGKSPEIYTAPTQFSANATLDPIAAVQSWAAHSGSNWRVYMRVYVNSAWFYPSSTYGRMLVITKCSI